MKESACAHGIPVAPPPPSSFSPAAVGVRAQTKRRKIVKFDFTATETVWFERGFDQRLLSYSQYELKAIARQTQRDITRLRSRFFKESPTRSFRGLEVHAKKDEGTRGRQIYLTNMVVLKHQDILPPEAVAMLYIERNRRNRIQAIETAISDEQAARDEYASNIFQHQHQHQRRRESLSSSLLRNNLNRKRRMVGTPKPCSRQAV